MKDFSESVLLASLVENDKIASEQMQNDLIAKYQHVDLATAGELLAAYDEMRSYRPCLAGMGPVIRKHSNAGFAVARGLCANRLAGAIRHITGYENPTLKEYAQDDMAVSELRELLIAVQGK